ncbi:MAG: redox-regulated ATPase YchF [Oscillospiraceae bacterium]|jgi:GTP-binding protein YchF|nr:redox-regulated ATPase YchF [Oscillospiraceae bacterium]
MKIGIIGLPNVGKSALFSALTGIQVDSENYPFCTIEPNISTVPVPDERLKFLALTYKPQKVINATIEFVDIAGLIRGASKGEGLGNKFLSNIREVDAIIHVVRCFIDEEIVHVESNVDPERDIETVNLELIFSDIETVKRRIEKTEKLFKAEKKYGSELMFWKDVDKFLQNEKPARMMNLTEEEKIILKSSSLLTAKPIIYFANIAEKFVSNVTSDTNFLRVSQIASTEKAPTLPICAEFEAQISQMEPKEKMEFLKDAGLKESGLERLIKACYERLGLISFLTAGPSEVRAWTIVKGTKAPQAAGKIHSDMERGFIRAEVISFDSLMEFGSFSAAREKGKISSEGKNYVMKDGDVVIFRFNV